MSRSAHRALTRKSAALVVGLLLGLTACGEDAPSEPEETVTPTSEPADTPTAEPTASPEPTATPSATEERPPTDEPQDDSTGESVTEADSGSTVTVAVGQELPLRLGSDWSWDEPQADGAAVSLTRVDYLVDPGYVEWLIVGEQAGTAKIITTGAPACGDEAQCPPTDFDLNVEVEDR